MFHSKKRSLWCVNMFHVQHGGQVHGSAIACVSLYAAMDAASAARWSRATRISSLTGGGAVHS